MTALEAHDALQGAGAAAVTALHAAGYALESDTDDGDAVQLRAPQAQALRALTCGALRSLQGDIEADTAARGEGYDRTAPRGAAAVRLAALCEAAAAVRAVSRRAWCAVEAAAAAVEVVDRAVIDDVEATARLWRARARAAGAARRGSL